MNQQENTKKRNKSKSWILLLLLLLSLSLLISVGGITLAKYVTKGNGTGTASVAKWGYKIQANAADIFGSKYAFDTDASKVTTSDTSLTVKVTTPDTGNRVAPGTTGSMTFSIGGTAEVKSKLTVAFAANEDVYLKVTPTDSADFYTYTPVVWTLKKGGTQVATGTLANIAAYFDAYKTGKTIEAGETADVNGEYELSWAWKFENSTLPTGLTGFSADELDTVLGSLASEGAESGTNNKGAYAASTAIDFAIEITAEQLER